MFGKPAIADADVMMAEARTVLAETATALETECPDPTATDAQALMAWTIETMIHVVREYGRWDIEVLRSTVISLTLMRFARPYADRWDETVHEAQASRLKALLTRYVRESRPGLSEAAAQFHRGLARMEPKPALSEEQFVRVAASALGASMTRLQNAGYIRVR